eukprot:CAMPEP_0195510774 /NCGR_PEP_ID=MMETSP0794_2-20130614/3323_1 /TAXON_ID=515487 /ORGANISM="Stephanopyxis turris, Strain CCMP 815" /LENGTH=65 /DNA_ID=CAMNT_0040638261 /DNA_START=528 /DNA_END=722 /DNA_ORIENTATION=-
MFIRNNGSDKAYRIHIDRIATAAYERGWIQNMTRSVARGSIEKHMNDLGITSPINDFPLDCLTLE